MPFPFDMDLYNSKPVPVRYDLIFRMDGKKPVFVLSAFTDLIKSVPSEAPIIKSLQKRFGGIGEFVNSNDGLGFGGVFVPYLPFLPLKGFSTWRALIPFKVIGDKKSDWSSAYKLACSISVIAIALEYAKCESNPRSLQQLATHLLVCNGGMGGFGIAATLSPVARNWIATHRPETEATARTATIAVYEQMWPDYFREDKEFRLHDFRVWDNGNGTGLVIDIPGQACGLYVDGMDLDKGPGWSLDTHNVDSPIQQLSLLAGLCSILALVRQDQLKG